MTRKLKLTDKIRKFFGHEGSAGKQQAAEGPAGPVGRQRSLEVPAHGKGSMMVIAHAGEAWDGATEAKAAAAAVLLAERRYLSTAEITR